jgi:hypothetical protein
MPRDKSRKILAIASSGGHWIQLLRLRPAFAGAQVSYASVGNEAASAVSGDRYFSFPDANRERKVALILQILCIAWIVMRVRPDVIVSTGASCGYVAIRIGRILGARTMFIDSLANAEKLSLSAELVNRHAHLLLTQWPHLSTPDGPQYHGSVL